MIKEVENLNDKLIYARVIQLGLLPKHRHFKQMCNDYFVYYKPMDFVGGDFYWLSKTNETTYLAVADCSGHGTAGAMLSVLGISLLNYAIIKNYNSVGEILNEIDKKWVETFKEDHHEISFDNDWMEITLCSFNNLTREFQYSSANGEFFICNNEGIRHLRGNNYPIGGWQIEKKREFETHKIVLHIGDTIYFFSDGIKHQFNPKNKKFSKKRLSDLVQSFHGCEMEAQKKFFEDAFNSWKMFIDQTDDVILLGIRF